jgi:AcrR family transcriptional regulator
MGINPPSLYAAFGDKEQLFRKALDRYVRGPDAYEDEALALPTAREVAYALLRGGADRQTRPRMPHGCLAVLGARTNGADSTPAGAMLIETRRAGEAQVRERFERALAEDDLPAGTDPKELADYVRAVLHGMTVQASSGATRDELERVIERAMAARPS